MRDIRDPEKITIAPLCNAYIDQNRYIGKDPVGHKCSGPARWETSEGYLICSECKKMLAEEPGRVSFIGPPQGVKEQQERVDSIAARSTTEQVLSRKKSEELIRRLQEGLRPAHEGPFPIAVDKKIGEIQYAKRRVESTTGKILYLPDEPVDSFHITELKFRCRCGARDPLSLTLKNQTISCIACKRGYAAHYAEADFDPSESLHLPARALQVCMVEGLESDLED